MYASARINPSAGKPFLRHSKPTHSRLKHLSERMYTTSTHANTSYGDSGRPTFISQTKSLLLGFNCCSTKSAKTAPCDLMKSKKNGGSSIPTHIRPEPSSAQGSQQRQRGLKLEI
ncbi:hypothetical protein M409DRAFT_60324 [Zasmidium cellare ATCC 36951]|uniref:Uncharacterized protein n=1 Tax=Zasmidium cellare ATCC 36951 TaxID=1080233 RepID=A0A6A6BZM5_ZASCE|nr:uncharacterized protein M409DRAFT_60324 [Zasmidium cellare ATCC 36951]KAF2160073.1 hypothetical protein M409DRAFT_60324 [Zasmidium cellare ATCC 36951]